MDKLSDKIEPEKLDSKYFYEYIHENIEHIKDVINTCSLNIFIQKDNSIKSYSNFIKYKTIKEDYIDKIIDFSLDSKYECRILLLNKKLNIKSEINHWYERIACFDLTSNNIFECILNDDLGINEYIFNETINIKNEKYNILKKIIENLV
jgi:hypothetical protein